MNRRLLLCCLLAAAPLSAQFQLSTPQGDVERPVTDQYDFGSVPSEDARDVRFRARNASSYQALLSAVSVGGTGFSLVDPPKVPVIVESGAFVDFTIRFRPPAPGSYSAVLRVNALSPILRGSGASVPLLYLVNNGERRALTTGDTVDLGDVERKSSVTRRFVLENRNAQPVTVQKFEIAGEYFSGGTGFAGPVTIASGGTYTFDVVFAPQAAGIRDGAILLDQRRILFRANVVEPALPDLSVSVEPQALASAQQSRLSIRFAEPSRGNWTGKTTLLFEPSVPVSKKDPAILFQVTNAPEVGFTVVEGDDRARFGTRADVDFQTGTTAGTLTIVVEAGSYRKELQIAIAAAAVGIDTVRASRTASGLEVYAAGFDNTRSASQAGFTFYDSAGNTLGSGTIRADVKADFTRYFEASDVGGVFSLRATFPLTGDPARVAGVEIEFVNSAGTARSKRVTF